MHRNNEIFYKILIIILVFTIVFITLVRNISGICELNEGNLINKYHGGNNMKNVEANGENKNKSNNEENKIKDIINNIDFNIEPADNRVHYLNTKVLYFSRHEGTIANFSTIARLLSFDVTVIEPWVNLKTIKL